MPCENCLTARECDGLYRMFTPKCVYCGARLIQSIQRLCISPNEKVVRCCAVLADWLTFDHNETELRRLAKEPGFSYEPEQHKSKAKKK